MAKPRYTVRRVGATATPVQTLALANQLRPFFTGAPGSGGAGAASYLHPQPVASAVWTINHNLGYRPAVTVLSVGGMVMLANVQHTSVNQTLVYFDQPTPGQAACS